MSNSLSPGQMFAQYRIEAYLGHGAMGVVYKVFDPQRNKHLALKVLQTNMIDPKHRMSFIREVKAIAHLNHKNVVKLYDVGSHPQYYFTMEYVPGRTLAEVIAAENLPQNVVGEIFSKLALALYHAHSRNIVHGDIKPRNIIISENFEPKIADFGLACEKNTERKNSRVQGTPAYLSPEQLNNKKVDKRSDIYALGVTMYYTLTGKLPFDEKNPAALFYQIGHTSPIPLCDIDASISPYLQNICLKCLEKLPENRYANGKFLYKDLQSFLYPAWYSHPVLQKCFSSTVMELLLVLGIIISMWIYVTGTPKVNEVHSIWEFERDKLLRREYKERMLFTAQMRLEAHMKNFDRHHKDDAWKNEVIHRWRKQLNINKSSSPRLLFSFARSIVKLKDMFAIANLGPNNIPFEEICIWGNQQALKANDQELTQKFRVLIAIARGKKDKNSLPLHMADANYYLATQATGKQREQYLLRGIAAEPLPYILKELVSFYHAHHLYDKAIYTAQMCLKKYPYNMVVRYYLAINLFVSGDTTQALYHMNIVDKHYHSGHKELLFLQRAQMYMTQSEWTLARQDLQKAQRWIKKYHKDNATRETVGDVCKEWLRVLEKIRNNNWNFDLPNKGMEAKFYYSLGKIEKAYALVDDVSYASLRLAIYREMLERQGEKLAKVQPIWLKAYNDVLTCAKKSLLHPKNNMPIYYEYIYLFLHKCPKNERGLYLKQSADLRKKMQHKLQYHYERYASEAHLAYENGQMAKAVFLWERAIAKAPWCKEYYQKLRDDALAATLNVQKK